MLLLCAGLLLSSCVVQHPKYAHLEDTYRVQVGMSLDSVNKILQVEPFALHQRTDSNYTYNYKFRVKEVKRVPIVMNRNKGLEVETRFVDLFITYNSDGLVTNMESCNDCSDDGEKRELDFNTLITGLTTVVTVTIPVVLTLIATN